jgi:hypothetical protein
MRISILTIALVALMMACNAPQENTTVEVEQTVENATYELVLASEVEWNHLNPKRGDLAPSAGTLWGDRNGKEATGFLLKPSDGFASPPHIHNVSYRGVVIAGELHNDDPNAANMWMPAGSFWTQPKGEVHITCAQGAYSLAYIEIEEGPYLVLPPEEAFDSGERPVNVDHTNIVWLGADDLKWVDAEQGAKVAFLWGSREEAQLSGTLIKLPVGFEGKIHSDGESFRAVVVEGEPTYQSGEMAESKKLETGSYFGSFGAGNHMISTTEQVLLYVRSDAKVEVH